MAHAHCILDTKDYKHTLRICNTYCFPSQQWLQERASVLRYNTLPNLFPFRLQNVLHAVASANDRLCGLVVRVSGYRYRGPGFDPRRYQIFWNGVHSAS